MELTPRTYLPLRRIDWRVVFGFFVVLTVCLFFYRQLDYVANGEHRPPLLTFLEEAIGCMAGFVIFPATYFAAVRFPLLSRDWRRNLLIQLLALCCISAVHTSLIAGLRALLLPFVGFGSVSYGSLPVRYPMEFAHLFIFYWLGVALIYFFHEIRFAREREVRQARLEASLSEVQLENLRLQLEPHFLFNALNTISAAIYEDPRVADEMIGRLSELLRQLLKSERSQQVPLVREIELLQLYLHLMQARFENRLHVSIQVDESAKPALVPQLLLQPLVENALRHGIDPVTFNVDVEIHARSEAGKVFVVIRDHGPGFEPGNTSRDGIGLRNTRQRLEQLYGKEHSFVTRNASAGGAVVELAFPLSRVPDAAAQPLPVPISA